MVALDLDVIVDTRERGDFLSAAEEALGLGEAIAPGIDFLRLFFDVLEEALQETARFGHLSSLSDEATQGAGTS